MKQSRWGRGFWEEGARAAPGVSLPTWTAIAVAEPLAGHAVPLGEKEVTGAWPSYQRGRNR